MRRAGTRLNAGSTSRFAVPDLRRRVLFVLVGSFGVLHRVIETVW